MKVPQRSGRGVLQTMVCAAMLLLIVMTGCASPKEGQNGNSANGNTSQPVENVENTSASNSNATNPNSNNTPSDTSNPNATKPDSSSQPPVNNGSGTPAAGPSNGEAGKDVGVDPANPETTAEPEVLIKEVVKNPERGSEQYQAFLATIPKEDLLALLSVEDRAASLTPRERLAGLTRAELQEILPKSLFIDQYSAEDLFDVIQSRLSADQPSLEMRMQLVAYLLASNSDVKTADPTDIAVALEHLDYLKLQPDISQEWLLTQSSVASALIGEYRAAYDYVTRAQSLLLNNVPFEIIEAFHASDRNPTSDGKYPRRVLAGESRENAMYRPGDNVIVAFSYRFLNGVRDEAGRTWKYSIQLEAELFESDPSALNGRGKKVEDFRPRFAPITRDHPLPPNEVNQGHISHPLPIDILPEKDYVLVIRMEDLYSPAKTKRERQVVVKVRR